MNKIKVTNPEKVLFPIDKVKKIDVINYYVDICKLMLPYIENRIISVIRCHENIEGECFFKKHPTNDKDFINIYKIDKEDYFYINKDFQLIYQVQMGTLEFHTGSSNIKNFDKPNIMVFDLDPDEKLPLSKLRSAVLKVKSALEELNIECFLKTSGGKGYHIVVPFKSSKNWQTFYDFSKQVAIIVESKWPKIFTTNIKKAERKGKIFLDYLRNNKGSTCVAPYSLRARKGATISMPILWQDLNRIKPNEITIKNYKKYLNHAWDKFFEIDQKLK